MTLERSQSGDPASGGIELECISCGGKLRLSGSIWNCGYCGASYPIVNGVHDFLAGDLNLGEYDVAECYSYIWREMSTMHDSAARIRHRRATYALWFGLDTADDWRCLLEGKRVMDAGTGCGMAEHLFIDYPEILYGVDLSDGIVTAAEYWRDRTNFIPIKASIFKLPIPDETLDVILSFGVLHHTRDTSSALGACVSKLRRGGKILFYIYRKKSPIREFSDDRVRKDMEHLSLTESWTAVQPIALLGAALQQNPVPVSISVDVPQLQLKAGTYSVYDLIHWHLFSCFWSPAYTQAENQRVSLDWYKPKFSRRHTPEEVIEWADRFGLEIERFRVLDNGIAVIAKKSR